MKKMMLYPVNLAFALLFATQSYCWQGLNFVKNDTDKAVKVHYACAFVGEKGKHEVIIPAHSVKDITFETDQVPCLNSTAEQSIRFYIGSKEIKRIPRKDTVCKGCWSGYPYFIVTKENNEFVVNETGHESKELPQ